MFPPTIFSHSPRGSGDYEPRLRVAHIHLKHFVATPGITTARLARPDAALERDIIVAWYTGVHQVRGQAQLVTYTGALVWRRSACRRPVRAPAHSARGPNRIGRADAYAGPLTCHRRVRCRGALRGATARARGVKVLILEAGPRVQRPAALAQYRNALIKIPECPYPDTPYAPHPVSDNPDHYSLQDGPDKFASPYFARSAARRGTGWARRFDSCRTIFDCDRSSASASTGRSRTTISNRGTATPSASLVSPAIRTPISTRHAASRIRCRRFH